MEEHPATPHKQPGQGTVVWQHNRLAEARYELSPREQKLLLYVIAMIEPEDKDFERYEVNIAQFAEMAGLDKRHLYLELRELAQSIASKPLVIPEHFDPKTGQHAALVTNWFAKALVSPNGEGYFGIEFTPELRPYLLQVKRDFFQYRLQQVMQMRSAYAIRLYQWLKRWEFRRKAQVSVAELRGIMGAVQPGKRGKLKVNLAPYADFKRRAIVAALAEVNEKSDLTVKFSEVKARGSKAVESLTFTILTKDAETEAVPLPAKSAQPQLELHLNGHSADDDDLEAGERFVVEAKAKYGLSQVQADKVQKYCEAKGAAYVREKMAVVDREPRQNAARAFLAALRDDWQPPIKAGSKKKEPAPAPGVPDYEKGAAALKGIKEGLRGGK